VVKVKTSGKHFSGAKGHRFLSTIFGTAKAAPFQNKTFTTGC
jgi:hypothetical protein